MHLCQRFLPIRLEVNGPKVENRIERRVVLFFRIDGEDGTVELDGVCTPAGAGVYEALQRVGLAYLLSFGAARNPDPTAVPEIVPPFVMNCTAILYLERSNAKDLIPQLANEFLAAAD